MDYKSTGASSIETFVLCGSLFVFGSEIQCQISDLGGGQLLVFTMSQAILLSIDVHDKILW